MRRAVVIGVALLLGMVSGCQTPAPSAPPVSAGIDSGVRAALYRHGREWHGVPYRLGGASRAGVDCSGFVHLTYRSLFGMTIPRHTAVQAQAGREVSKGSLQPGDLVFFQTGRNTRHVGIYIEGRQFLHASTERGVMISRLDNHYWSGRYWKAVRLLH